MVRTYEHPIKYKGESQKAIFKFVQQNIKHVKSDYLPISNLFSKARCLVLLFDHACSNITNWLLQQRIWYSEDLDDGSTHDNDHLHDPKHDMQQAIGFSVKNAVLFPTEVEKGMWPEDYSLSDHARLTVVLSPVRMPCSKLIF